MNVYNFMISPAPHDADRLEAETVGALFDEVWAIVEAATDEELETLLEGLEDARARANRRHASNPPPGHSNLSSPASQPEIGPRHDVLILTSENAADSPARFVAMRRRAGRRAARNELALA